MEAESTKKIIDKNLDYGEVKRLIVRLVQYASPQTELLEAEPQVLGLIDQTRARAVRTPSVY
jgi:hypothetical protein